MNHLTSRTLDRKLVEGVATLLSQPAAMHKDFIAAVNDYMSSAGYMIAAEQRGVQGTYISIVRTEQSTESTPI